MQAALLEELVKEKVPEVPGVVFDGGETDTFTGGASHTGVAASA